MHKRNLNINKPKEEPTEVNDSPIKVQDIKNGNKVIGSMLYDTCTENLILRTKLGLHYNILTDRDIDKISTKTQDIKKEDSTIKKEDDVINYQPIKYAGLWDKEHKYLNNTIVKYKSKFYLAIEESINSQPSKLINWDMFSYVPQTQTKEIATLGMNTNMTTINTIVNVNIPITFQLNNSADFLEFIEAKSAIYICKPGSYQVTYNIAFSSPLTYCQIVLFTKNGENVSINKQGSAFLSKTNTLNMIAVNHSFVLNIENNKENNKTMSSIDTDNISLLEGVENNKYYHEQDVKLTLVMRIEQDDINRSIEFYPDNSWMTIYEI